MKHIEVEQKYQLPDATTLRAGLKARNAKKLGMQHQVDTYYNAPHRDFLAPPNISEWLRLRREDGRASINYKRWLPLDAKIKTHCDEYESPIGDIEAVSKLLEALDFTQLIIVDKQREEWQLSDIVIAIDQVKSLGSFVEFEYKGEAQNVEEAHRHIDECIATLSAKLGERNHVGYPYLLLAQRHGQSAA